VIVSRFGHGSEFSKLASSEQEEQTDYVVGVSPQTILSAIGVIHHPSPVSASPIFTIEIDLGSFILHYISLHLLGRCDHHMQVHG
jgi:hypothetical protein